MIELAASLKLLLYISLIACIFCPFGMTLGHAGPWPYLLGGACYLVKLALAVVLLATFETSIAKMRVFRVPGFIGVALMLSLLATLLRFVSGNL
jgi:formate hydrogenlyase subunit 4